MDCDSPYWYVSLNQHVLWSNITTNVNPYESLNSEGTLCRIKIKRKILVLGLQKTEIIMAGGKTKKTIYTSGLGLFLGQILEDNDILTVYFDNIKSKACSNSLHMIKKGPFY